MAWDGMGAFVRALEERGELVRVRRRVDAAPRDRRHRRPRHEGRAARRCSSRDPSGAALSAAHQRLRLARAHVAGARAWTTSRSTPAPSPSSCTTRAPSSARELAQLALKLPELAHVPPRPVAHGACQDVVATGDDVDLDALPILTCWPDDGGPFITLPQVITRDPRDGRPQRRLLPDAEARPAQHGDALAGPQDRRAALPPRARSSA